MPFTSVYSINFLVFINLSYNRLNFLENQKDFSKLPYFKFGLFSDKLMKGNCLCTRLADFSKLPHFKFLN